MTTFSQHLKDKAHFDGLARDIYARFGAAGLLPYNQAGSLLSPGDASRMRVDTYELELEHITISGSYYWQGNGDTAAIVVPAEWFDLTNLDCVDAHIASLVKKRDTAKAQQAAQAAAQRRTSDIAQLRKLQAQYGAAAL